jgi:hypothetical protein
MVNPADIDIAQELAKRDRHRLHLWRQLTLSQRLQRMLEMDRARCDLSKMPAPAYDRFMRRNMSQRSIDVS